MKNWSLALLLACAAYVVSVTASAQLKEAGLYSTKLTGEVVVGKEGNLELRILPAKGYKWNKDYPAKITLPNSKLVQFKKSVLKARDGDIKAEKTSGLATMTCTGTTTGTETLTAEASFSVCSEETCQVLRKRKVSLSVVVK